jgi:two-component sensor histidine kinase
MQVGTPFSAAKVCTLLGEFSLRVETIAKLHQTLAANSDSDLIDLDRFLVEICSSVRSLSPSAAVALSVDCLCGQQLEPAKALPIGLIAAEMLTNAIKYAHPTGIPARLNISTCETSDGAVFVEVADDGIGLPEGFDTSKDGGLGFRIIRSLAGQIGGDLEFTQGGIGTACKLTVKILPKQHPSRHACTASSLAH